MVALALLLLISFAYGMAGHAMHVSIAFVCGQVVQVMALSLCRTLATCSVRIPGRGTGDRELIST